MLPNILKGNQTMKLPLLLKGNQTMKFGQLIECNMRNIFLENSHTKCGGETSPRPFHFILSFFRKIKRSGKQSPCLIFCIIFEEKYLSCYILLIDQISVSGYLYFVRYWAICVLQLFVNQVMTSQLLKLTLSF